MPADTVQFHPMALRHKSIVLKDLFLKFLDPGIHDLDEPAALGADQMIMMPVIRGMFITAQTILALELFTKARLTQKPQGPVDRGAAYAWMFPLDITVDLVHRQMFGARKNRPKDMHPLDAKLEPLAGDIVLKGLGVFLGEHDFNPF